MSSDQAVVTPPLNNPVVAATLAGNSASVPTGEVYTDTSHWFTGDTVSITGCFEAEAGIKLIETAPLESVIWEGDYEGTWYFTYSGDDTAGTYIEIILTDNEDQMNEEDIYCTVMVDRSAPVIALTYEAANPLHVYTSGKTTYINSNAVSANVTAMITDATSGVNASTVKFAGKDPSSTAGDCYTFTLALSKDSGKTVTVSDNAGNAADATVSYTLDGAAPTKNYLQLSGESGIYHDTTNNVYWAKQGVTAAVEASFSDEVSGFYKAEFNSTEVTTNPCSWSFDTSSESASSSYSVTAYDNVMNSEEYTITIGVDGTAPEVTVTADTKTTAKSVTVTITAEDLGSGVRANSISCRKGTEGEWTSCGSSLNITENGTYQFCAYDNVGHSGVTAITIDNIKHTITGGTSPAGGNVTITVGGETVTTAAAGVTVTVTADEASADYVFAGFSSDPEVTFTGEDYSYTFIMPNSDITVLATYNHTGTAYINSEYTGDYGTKTTDGHTVGVDAFTNFDDARALNYVTMEQTAGSYGDGSTLTVNAAQGSALTVNDAVYNKKTILSGGIHSNTAESRTWVDEKGDASVTILNGTFGGNVIGADVCTSGSLSRTGNVTMNISGGTFSEAVAGGVYYRTSDRTSYLDKNRNGADIVGDINMNISGGTFNWRVYGGNYSTTDEYGAQTAVYGNISLTIDARTQKVTFKENVIAGSRGDGWIYGNINVTVTGSGSNLTFGTGKYLYGASGLAYYRTSDTSERKEISYATGDRNLVFNDFQGEFSGRIWMFKSIEFAGTTQMSFMAEQQVNLNDIHEWELHWDGNTDTYADLTNVTSTFTGDAVNIAFDAAAAEDVLLTGAAGCFDSLSGATVTFNNGAALDYDSTNRCWVEGKNKLFIEDDGGTAWLKMVQIV